MFYWQNQSSFHNAKNLIVKTHKKHVVLTEREYATILIKKVVSVEGRRIRDKNDCGRKKKIGASFESYGVQDRLVVKWGQNTIQT